ncbi:MAG: hypothetical protein NC906_04835, partial [Candidatus Omnitrophica bacterium]|nr:hypothetical protein [Candidatus Omnitrophota bacterium]
GLIRLRDLEDDFYVYDEKKYAIIGRRTKKTYRLGDKVTVKLVRVNTDKMEIDFSTNYENNNLYVIAYTVIDLGEGGELVPAPGGGFYWSQGVAHIVRQVFAFLFPTIKHEKEQLLPPYFRPEQVPDEE